MGTYSIQHCHSTCTNDTLFDSTANFEDYIEKAKERDVNSISFTEHGNVLQWIKKKEVCDKNGIKYIHGCEFYMAFDLDKQERQQFHVCLYAKNFDGVREINKLSSISFEGRGEKWYKGIQFYYRPRISFEQLKNTSENIIVSTACLASPLWRLRGQKEYNEYIDWLEKNKDRTFLEVQPHIKSNEQKEYNLMLLSESKKRGIKIIAGTDTHVLNKEDNELRNVLNSGKKGKVNETEELFELHMRSYDELFDEFREQGVLSENEILEAIENTNILSEMCENWEIDKSYKYPRISKNPEEELWKRIEVGMKNKKMFLYDSDKYKTYFDKIKFEYDTYVQLGMCDYIILLDDIIKFCKKEGISTAPRGSCNGSQSLWVLGITDIDPVRFGTLFFRFVNPSRISLGDVDIDMAGSLRPKVKDYLYNKEGISGSAIVTFSKLALRGACRLVAKGLGYDMTTEDMVAKDIEEVKIEHEDETVEIISTFHNKEKWEKEYPKLIELTYKAQGIIMNTSVHACGFVAFDGDIEEEIGVFRNKKSKWVVSQNDMKAIDSVNFVKMDFLSVDNVQIVSEAEKETGIILDNDTIDLEDDNVWNEMLKSGLGIFQFEKSGWFSLKKALENYNIFKKNNEDVTRYFIMLALNGVIRPSCASFREDFLAGVPYDNGHPEINRFFSNMNNYCLFQEQIMQFLEKFCHYTGAESDNVRKAISKKGGTDKLLPEIKSSFMKHFPKDFNSTQQETEIVIDKFLKIIDNAKNYGFSVNHSTPYTLIGFKNAYYRHYYPLEYLTTQLNVNDGKLEKTKNIIEFIKSFTDIKLNGIKFGQSSSNYKFNKEENSIYKGIGSIKNMGKDDGEQLYELRKNKYESFTDLLLDIKTKTKVNKGKIEQLTELDFFTEFGGAKKLYTIAELFYTWQSKKTAKFYNKKKDEPIQLPFREEILERHSEKRTDCQYSGVDFVAVIKEIESLLEDEDYSMKEKIDFQREYLGYVNISDSSIDKRYILVTNLDTKYSPKFDGYCLSNGKSQKLKARRKPKRRQPNNTFFEDRPFEEGDIIYVNNFERKMGMKKVDEDWVETGEFDWWCKNYRLIKEGEI